MENKHRCPKCKSSQVYIRISTKEIVCRQCGSVSPKSKHQGANQ